MNEKFKGPYTQDGTFVRFDNDPLFSSLASVAQAQAIANALNGAYVLGYTHRMLEDNENNDDK